MNRSTNEIKALFWQKSTPKIFSLKPSATNPALLFLSRTTAMSSKKHYSRLFWQPLNNALQVTETSPEALALYAAKPHSSLAAEVRAHLCYLGWKVEFSTKDDVTKYRYTMPDNPFRVYYSLQKLCIDLISPLLHEQKKETLYDYGNAGDDNVCVVEKKNEYVNEVNREENNDLYVGEYNPQAVVDWFTYKGKNLAGGARARELVLKAKKHLAYMGWEIWYINKSGGRRELRYTSPKGSTYISLRVACKAYIDECGGVEKIFVFGSCNREKFESSFSNGDCGSRSLSKKMKHKEKSFCPNGVESETELSSTKKTKRIIVIDDESHELQKRKGKKFSDLIRSRDFGKNKKSYNQRSSRNLRSSKRIREGVVARGKSSGIISCLIENNVVLQGARVGYFRKDEQFAIAGGLITKDGIKCNCCQKLFNLDSFQMHSESGKTKQKAATCMFLSDGRSLSHCVVQLRKILEKKAGNDDANTMKTSAENDDVCSVCRYGGELVLCDECPSAFHLSCLGVEDLPEGDWFCKSCCCQICGLDGGEANNRCMFISCSQCDLKYHTKCLERQNMLRNYPESKWFCCSGCEIVSLRLQLLLGQKIKVNDSNLNWTLLRYSDELDSAELTETYSKLTAAVEVMHECFEPSKDPRTGRDLVNDVIFSKWSNLNRLNFKNFNTIILEKDGEVISVATLRVHGQRVAELPLIATRFEHRLKGMCRVMMDELEKQLEFLGVERLILPAALPVLETWTKCFGFSEITKSEKLQLLNHTFLDFQDTITCQKVLVKREGTESYQSSPQSEVLQARDHNR